jgi:hypothetical protein
LKERHSATQAAIKLHIAGNMETQQAATKDIPLDSYPIVSWRPDLANLQQG